MKKLLFFVLALLFVVFGYVLVFPNPGKEDQTGVTNPQKKPILRVGLVADSHNENELLAKALVQAQGRGINFVIGLGDYTNLGTIDELGAARATFDHSRLEYFVTAGDRDGWDTRNRTDGRNNFEEIFSHASQVINKEEIRFVLLDNSDIYNGIDSEDWDLFTEALTKDDKDRSENRRIGESEKSEGLENQKFGGPKLTFVFTHKTPFHPDSAHVMGEDSEQAAGQAKQLIKLIESRKVDGLFSGDLHFFAQFKSPSGSVKITTVGAISAERNFQGPRFEVLTVFEDWTWEVEDIEIR